jgi:hypothetical protein
MINPYFCYAFAFTLGLVAYSFGFSDLYPALSLPVLVFLTTNILLFILFGSIVWRKQKIFFVEIQNKRNNCPLLITIFIYSLWSIEFFYEGGVPLIKILSGEPYNYRIFGVPSLHVFVVTFSSFYTIFLFHLYIAQRRRTIFLLFFLNLIAAILIYNRGMLFFNLSAVLSLYLIYKGTITIKQQFVIAVSVVLIFFLFGVMGAIRTTREAKRNYSNDPFLHLGGASQSFKESIVPNEFFWSYVYISSPLANVQNNIDTYVVDEIGVTSFVEWFNNEVLPDFISKRINSITHIERKKVNTIPGPFNASSILCRSYSYLGWTGIVIMVVLISIIPVIFFKLLPTNSPFFLTGLAILNTMFLFMVFENTLTFTGLSFQMTYPIILTWASKHFDSVKKMFL